MSPAEAQKLGAVEPAAEFFLSRSAGAGKGLQSYLDLIPDAPPARGDEMPSD